MSVEYYKKQIIDLRARLEKEKEAKKKAASMAKALGEEEEAPDSPVSTDAEQS